MKVKVQKDGRITLPKRLREEAYICEGQWLRIRLEDGTVLLHPLETPELGLGLVLHEDHPIWELVGRWAGGRVASGHPGSGRARHLR